MSPTFLSSPPSIILTLSHTHFLYFSFSFSYLNLIVPIFTTASVLQCHTKFSFFVSPSAPSPNPTIYLYLSQIIPYLLLLLLLSKSSLSLPPFLFFNVTPSYHFSFLPQRHLLNLPFILPSPQSFPYPLPLMLPCLHRPSVYRCPFLPSFFTFQANLYSRVAGGHVRPSPCRLSSSRSAIRVL